MVETPNLIEMSNEEIKKIVKEFLIDRLIDPDEGHEDYPLIYVDYVIFIIDEKTLLIKLFKKIVEYDEEREEILWKKPMGITIMIKLRYENGELKVIDVS